MIRTLPSIIIKELTLIYILDSGTLNSIILPHSGEDLTSDDAVSLHGGVAIVFKSAGFGGVAEDYTV